MSETPPNIQPLSGGNASIPDVGQVVRVRIRTWLVEGIEPSAGYGSLLSLACLDDDAQGQKLEIVWELALDPQILDSEAWQSIGQRGFDQPRHFAAYVHTLRWNCVTATDPKLFQSPFRAGIRIDAYQLEPLRKALLLPRVNLFIADDVGLGKTIEAGLTGDNTSVARRIAEKIGITDVRAKWLPGKKLTIVRELEKDRGVIALIGDGVNDAPAMAAATVGVAMGAGGTAVALETADVVLLGDDVGKLSFAIGLSRAGARIIRQNLVHALGVIVLLLITSGFGVILLSVAVVLHEGSTIMVVLNALRLLAWHEPAINAAMKVEAGR